MTKQSKYDLQERLVAFSASIITHSEKLNATYAGQHLMKQLIRSSTASALNYGEAQAAESKKDFVHKMKVCLKELRETQVNLQILMKTSLIAKDTSFEPIVNECDELVAIFAASIKKVDNRE